jgi:hypothetical protein
MENMIFGVKIILKPLLFGIFSVIFKKIYKNSDGENFGKNAENLLSGIQSERTE